MNTLRELAMGNSFAELAAMVANLMILGYEPYEEYYVTPDGYHCQPMLLATKQYE